MRGPKKKPIRRKDTPREVQPKDPLGGAFDLGMSFDEASEKAGIKPIPESTYNLAVDQVALRDTRAGRPQVQFTFIVNEGDYAGRRLIYFAPLPWVNADGEYDDSGLGFLVNAVKALGKPWKGGTFVCAEYTGLTCSAVVEIGFAPDGTERNQISRFL